MSDKFEVTYRKLFRTYYASLLFYAKRIVGDDEAEDVVQDVFVELWHRKDTIEIGQQIQAFLYRAVYTRALNVLKHREVKDHYEALVQEIHQKRVDFYKPDNNEVIRRMENMDLRKEILTAINELPDKCKVVFKLSYLYDMKNKAIAEALGISQRTVESHMYKALKLLRSRLQYIHVFFSIFILEGISIF
ncbi:RNA polymerase ECF-type sigma factor [gut metagenome]|uniref:RNA polymerase ECF-type sigma factor n=1 Tax=gut metagenome TaxID=749906 RepID=J9FY29_9ZZZZ